MPEMESVCVEAFYLEEALMAQRTFAAAFDATFAQVCLRKSCCRRQLSSMRALGFQASGV